MAAFRTITVAQLRELLEDQADQALVVFSADYGDYHRTQQALPLRGEVEDCSLIKTGYSNSGYAIAEPDDEDAEDMGGETFIVIR
jgi:hypothetical protein